MVHGPCGCGCHRVGVGFLEGRDFYRFKPILPPRSLLPFYTKFQDATFTVTFTVKYPRCTCFTPRAPLHMRFERSGNSIVLPSSMLCAVPLTAVSRPTHVPPRQQDCEHIRLYGHHTNGEVAADWQGGVRRKVLYRHQTFTILRKVCTAVHFYHLMANAPHFYRAPTPTLCAAGWKDHVSGKRNLHLCGGEASM